MKLPAITGIIDRRILVNFIADPTVVAKILPPPFKPKQFNGKAIVGICLIRLKRVRPLQLPAFMGVSSENGAHRIAVEWIENNTLKEGVYIPRRDTSSLFNHLVGGRVFPGKHMLAKFNIQEPGNTYKVAFKSIDNTSLLIEGKTTSRFDTASVFENLETASQFFERGAIGYSPNGNKYDGLELRTHNWKVTPLEVSHVQSSFFENETLFPKGTVQFDHALIMKDIQHEWHTATNIRPTI